MQRELNMTTPKTVMYGMATETPKLSPSLRPRRILPKKSIVKTRLEMARHTDGLENDRCNCTKRGSLQS